MPETAREREDKYEVPAAFVLPDLSAALPPGGSLEHRTLRLSSTYYDTDARDLQRASLTLRRREGDADTGWHLKVPAGRARTEIREPLTEGIPQRLLELTFGVRGNRPLRPIALLGTDRTVCRLLAADGTPLAEVADDHVSGATTGTDAVVAEWREVEVELAAGDEALLAAVGELLRSAGATPAGYVSKVGRLLSARAPAPAEAGAATIGSVVQTYLSEQVDVLLAGDLALRQGQDVVHTTRVAVRRLRSSLRTFKRCFLGTEAAELAAELRKFALQLGRVRDAQVLRRRLLDGLSAVPPELVLGPVRARLDQTLVAERARATVDLQDTMAKEDYLRLLDSVRLFVADPPLAPHASRPAAKIKKDVRRAQRKAAARLDMAGADGSDESLHRARKAGKRARYAVEAATPVLGSGAAAIVDRYKQLQDLLGDQHDAVVAADVLLGLGRECGAAHANGFTFGLLYQRELDAAASLRASLPRLAKAVKRKSFVG